MNEVPKDHPRAQSLIVRHKIIQGMHENIVAEAGLIAHGRGEAYDYLIGEKTHEFSEIAIKAAASMLYLAENPIISVNGNITVLCPEEMIEYSNLAKIPLEINLFYRSLERMEAISNVLRSKGAKMVYGMDEKFHGTISEISSNRRVIDIRGIGSADVVFVPLEDGDRTEALVTEGKKVITVDLNPLSRTSKQAHITIIDNITRVFPLLQKEFFKITSNRQAQSILSNYDNKAIIRKALIAMSKNWQKSL